MITFNFSILPKGVEPIFESYCPNAATQPQIRQIQDVATVPTSTQTTTTTATTPTSNPTLPPVPKRNPHPPITAVPEPQPPIQNSQSHDQQPHIENIQQLQYQPNNPGYGMYGYMPMMGQPHFQPPYNNNNNMPFMPPNVMPPPPNMMMMMPPGGNIYPPPNMPNPMMMMPPGGNIYPPMMMMGNNNNIVNNNNNNMNGPFTPNNSPNIPTTIINPTTNPTPNSNSTQNEQPNITNNNGGVGVVVGSTMQTTNSQPVSGSNGSGGGLGSSMNGGGNGEVIKEGWFWKRNRQRRWQKRYGKLQNSSLFYYEKMPTHTGAIADGVITLPGSMIKRKSVNENNNIIVLSFPINNQRKFYFQAETDRELDLWYTEILKILEKASPGVNHILEATVKVKKLRNIKSIKDLHSSLQSSSPSSSSSTPKSPIFGVLLSSITHLHPQYQIPYIVVDAVAYLEGNIEVEGIFRKSGSALQIQDMRDKYNNRVPVDYSNITDPHCVAGLFKLFLREMPDPLLPYAFYDRFIAFEDVEEENKLAYMQNLLSQLPEINQRTIHFLFRFLKKVEAKSAVNFMTSNNLAIVFSPNIFRRENASMVESMMESRVANVIVSFLVEKTDDLFPESG